MGAKQVGCDVDGLYQRGQFVFVVSIHDTLCTYCKPARVRHREIGAIKNRFHTQCALVLLPELLVQQSTLFGQGIEYVLALLTQLLQHPALVHLHQTGFHQDAVNNAAWAKNQKLDSANHSEPMLYARPVYAVVNGVVAGQLRLQLQKHIPLAGLRTV